ncbi:nuclear factor Y, subunit B11 [Wolffia australiana]
MPKKADEPPVAAVEDLPRAIVRRIVKEKLSTLSSSSSRRVAAQGDVERESDGINVHKEALLAFSESARIFIHYLSATANDICKESKRQIINAEDVFKALEEIEFSEFVRPLRISLEDFRRKNAAKKAESKPREKKRKTDDADSAPTNTAEDDADDGLHD